MSVRYPKKMRKISTYSHRNAHKLIEKKFFNQLVHRLSKISSNYHLTQIKEEVKMIFEKVEVE